MMKVFKRLTAYILAAAMIISLLPVMAAAEDSYSISNAYMSFSFNPKTGGFSIETEEGNPKKVLDNNIPLLYSEDKEQSSGTSFITVRIGDKDYIFGQDYGFFGISSHLGTPEVTEEGRLITIPWTIKGTTVTLKAALGHDENSDITGNVGLSFSVENNSGSDENVSVRLLLDTALGNKIDAPYFVIDEDIKPTMTETEFSGDKVPSQIRAVDSLTNPTKLSYILTKGWNGGVEPSKVIIGHWANLANTRYSYTPDSYCDFTNYSNDYREPDSAAAIYWENKNIKNGESFTGEMLYGVGNFSNNMGEAMGVNITAGRVELAEDKLSYKNDGKIDVVVELDNTTDDAAVLSNVVANLTVDESKLKVMEGSEQVTYTELGKEIKTLKYTLQALPQTELCTGTIYVSVTGVKTLDDGTQTDVETAAQRNIILPSAGKTSEVQLNSINPEIVYTDGEKAVTISGKMKPLETILADDAAVELKLKHTTSNHTVTIDKKNIAFLDDSGEIMTFTTEETLSVGEYEIVFEINDSRLQESLGAASIVCSQNLQVSADKKYQLKSYGLIALVRSSDTSNADYDFFTFRTEAEFLKFYHGETTAVGALNKTKIKYNFGGSKESIKNHEILMTVRGHLREMKDESGKLFWQADYSSGDIVLNNMLSYEGDSPLKIYESGGKYTIEGDGLLKVVNSINVWRSKWSITAVKGIAYTLDNERLGKTMGKNVTINPLTLSLDGAATMIQSVGGFAVDLKYGVLSSQWYDDSDGMVTYGIGFGGSISLPIKAKKKDQQQDLTADQEDLSEELNNLFDESLSADQEDISGDMNSLFDETPKKTTTGDKIKKDTKLSEGQLSASVDNVLFGEKGDVKDGYVKVDDTGYIGIDSTFSIALPQDLLGSLVSNAPGIYASVKINTIENQYEINAGLNIKIIECEGILAFKQVNVKKKDVIVPDKVEFYIRDGLKIPVAPPVLFIAGLGGGINGLADTIGGEFDKLPPITILLFTRLEAIGVLTGDFNAKISLEGMSLKGDMKLKAKGLDKLMDLNAGISARWIEPWELNLYGNVSIIDGLIKGGITVTIADDYFYGYIFASICIPDSIPLVGGKELAGVEAAVSDEFIGANIKIIGIKFGVIYYWGEKVSFGKNINLSPPARNAAFAGYAALSNADDVTGYYGTNIHELSVSSFAVYASGENYKEAKVNVSNASGQNALLVEIPYKGMGIPQAGEITLINKDGKTVETVADDENGGGNMLVQHREDGDFIYVTVTDPAKITNGEWTVRYTTPNIEISSINMSGVDDIAEMNSCGIQITKTDQKAKTTEVKAEWNIDGSSEKLGTIDVYLTEDKDILSKIKTNNNTGDSLGVNIIHKTNAAVKSGKASETVVLPDALPSGKYYAAAVLSTTDGISLAVSDTAIDFVNTNLPPAVDGVKLSYGGNGELFVSVTDKADADYTHYIAEIVSDDGTTLENNIGQFEKGSNFVFGSQAGLVVGKKYHVNIKTLREEYKQSGEEYKTHYYYGTDTVTSNSITLPEPVMPKLVSVKTNIDTSGEEINTNEKNVVIEYTFENDVFVEMSLNGSKVYAFGNDPSQEKNYFRKDWKFVLDDLDDGDYVVDFTAYAKENEPKTTFSKDHIKGSQTDIKDAYFGFTVDTSAPVLSFAQNSVERKLGNDNISVIFGANTVIADEQGNYTIEGLTEKSAVLSLDGVPLSGTEEGVGFAANGSFSIKGALGEDETFKEHHLTAKDKAGNVSELMVYAVRGDGFAFNSLKLYLDGKEIQPNADGEKVITLKNGQNAKLSAAVVTSSGKVFTLKDTMINWNVMYEKNAIDMNNGTIEALIPGETAVKAAITSAKIQTADGKNRNEELADYTIIKIVNNSKSDLVDKITEAQAILAASPNVSDSKKEALQAEINKAMQILNNASSSEDDYTNGVTELEKAIKEFKTPEPTESPTATPTEMPTEAPTETPTEAPTAIPTAAPTAIPTATPTAIPTATPTAIPTAAPTATPTATPTAVPTEAPTAIPTATPTAVPTEPPTAVPTEAPTAIPTVTPIPTEIPTEEPTATPKPSSGGGGGGGGSVRYSITAADTENGKVTLSQKTASYGMSVTVTAIPDEGYEVADMLINGESVGANDIYIIKSITGNTEVKVVFEKKADEDKPDDTKPENNKLPFKDVHESDWFYDYVKSAYEGKLMNGITETYFEPETKLTRAMFVTILHRIDGEKTEGECEFNDVPKDAYYRNAVAWASANGIVNGMSETEFAPEENITREQMAAILYRYAQYKETDTSIGDDTNILSYDDYTDISEYAIPAMQYTSGSGLITGKTQSTLNPKDNTTRAEAAAVFVRFMDFVK